MIGLAEFLLTRMDELEHEADHAARQPHWMTCRKIEGVLRREPGLRCNCGLPALVLSECEAKRFQIGLAQAAAREHAMALPGSAGALMKGRASLADAFLRGMALPYAAHPDYRDEWKP